MEHLHHPEDSSITNLGAGAVVEFAVSGAWNPGAVAPKLLL